MFTVTNGKKQKSSTRSHIEKDTPITRDLGILFFLSLYWDLLTLHLIEIRNFYLSPRWANHLKLSSRSLKFSLFSVSSEPQLEIKEIVPQGGNVEVTVKIILIENLTSLNTYSAPIF